MNVRLLSQLSFLALVVTIVPLKAMYFHPLSAIEKMLVTRAIQLRGLDAVRQEVYDAEDSKRVKISEERFAFTRPTVLYIEMTFQKEDSETDPLAKNIFEKIQKIELKSGYIPKMVQKVTDVGIFSTAATNKIGKDTCYYWLEENGARVSAVQIKAELTNKQELKGIVDTYN